MENLPLTLSWLLMASGIPYLWMAFFLCLLIVFPLCGSVSVSKFLIFIRTPVTLN